MILFGCGVVVSGSAVHVDGWKGYVDLRAKGYEHKIRRPSRLRCPAHEVMPRVHRVAPLLKRWLLGTHQGAVGPEHPDCYVDEFTFRFTRRTSGARGLLFYRLLQEAANVRPVGRIGAWSKARRSPLNTTYRA